MNDFAVGILIAQEIEDIFFENNWVNRENGKLPFEKFFEQMDSKNINSMYFFLDDLILHLKNSLFSENNKPVIAYLTSARSRFELAIEEDEKCFLRVLNDMKEYRGLTKKTISLFTMLPEGTIANAITDKLTKIDSTHFETICGFDSVICWFVDKEKPPKDAFNKATWELWQTLFCHHHFLPDDISGAFHPIYIPVSKTFKKACSRLNSPLLKHLRGAILAENKKKIEASETEKRDFLELTEVQRHMNQYAEMKGLDALEKLKQTREVLPGLERVCEKCGELSKMQILSGKEISKNVNTCIISSRDYKGCPSCRGTAPLINKEQALEYLKEFENLDIQLLAKNTELIEELSVEELLSQVNLEIFCTECLQKLKAGIMSKEELEQVEYSDTAIDAEADNLRKEKNLRIVYRCSKCGTINLDPPTQDSALLLFDAILDTVGARKEGQQEKWEAANRSVKKAMSPASRAKCADYGRAINSDSVYKAFKNIENGSKEINDMFFAFLNTMIDIKFNMGNILFLKSVYPRTILLIFECLFEAGMKRYGFDIHNNEQPQN